MPRPKNPVLSYRLHKQSAQATVTVSANGTRRDITLGPCNSPESTAEYQRVLANLTAGRLDSDVPADLTVNELSVKFWKHVKGYYPPGSDGGQAPELKNYRYAIREFRGLYGDRVAREFGPLAFNALRERIVNKKEARPFVNSQCARGETYHPLGGRRRVAAADRWESLRAEPRLQTGRTTAWGPEPRGGRIPRRSQTCGGEGGGTARTHRDAAG